jgi:putative phosphoesterase
MGAVDLLFHLGDHYRDGQRLAEQMGVTVIGVAGNCDPRLGSSYELIELAGVRFYVTHGHTLGVKISVAELVQSAARHRCDVVLFGHTHVPQIFSDRGILFVNPGSTAYPRHGTRAGYAVLTLMDGRVSAELGQLN